MYSDKSFVLAVISAIYLRFILRIKAFNENDFLMKYLWIALLIIFLKIKSKNILYIGQPGILS